MCSEAEYAFSREKPTLSLQLEADYKPDGWLGRLCGVDGLVCDLSVPQTIDEEWRKLSDKLTQMKLAPTNPDEARSLETLPQGNVLLLARRSLVLLVGLHCYRLYHLSACLSVCPERALWQNG